MPSVTAGEIEGCLLGKLQAAERGGAHRRFVVRDEKGTVVASTMLSRSWRSSTQLSSQMVGQIRKQLGLERPADFEELLDCPLSRAEYLRLVNAP